MAVTRARRHIAVVCDTQTVQNHTFLKTLIEHMTQFGEVRTAFEYIHDIAPQNYTRDHKETKAGTSASSSSKQKAKGQPTSKVKQEHQKPSAGSRNGNTAGAKHKKSGETTLTEEEQKKSRYAEIREQVERFLEDLQRKELQFPSSFTSHDRLLVHQVAEELGLVHESRGEGKDRCISVSRPQVIKEAEEQTQEEEKTEAHERSPKSSEEEKLPNSPKEESQSQPPLDLKSLHLERMKREQQKREENARQRKQQNNAPTSAASRKSNKGL